MAFSVIRGRGVIGMSGIDQVFFDSIYREEGPSFGNTPPEALLEYLKRRPRRGYALDLGSGDGRIALHLARIGFHVTAIDISSVGIEKMVLKAQAQGIADRISGIVSSVTDWNYPREHFDLVVAVTCLDHLTEDSLPSMRDRILLCLRDHGALFVEVMTTDDPGFSGEGPRSELADQIRHYFRPNELLRLFMQDVRLLKYEQTSEWDYDHGLPHVHGTATLLGERPGKDAMGETNSSALTP